MRNLILSLCLIGLFLEISGLIWSSKKEQPSEIFLKLSEPPVRSIENPLENGYFLLLGIACSSTSNPVQVGYDIWSESDARGNTHEFDLEKPGRSDFRIPMALDHLVPGWFAPNPIEEFQRGDVPPHTSLARNSLLLKRYDQWLQMRFEDWGYAHPGMPRFEEIFGAHRLYIAAGFRQQTKTGLERLARDLAQWRLVLREARTLPLKLIAEIILEDDALLFSRILNHPSVDRSSLTRGLTLLQPLTSGEYSLRWPIQSQFMLGYKRAHHPDQDPIPQHGTMSASKESLARAAQLQPEMLRAIEHPRPRNFLEFSSSSQRTWDTYATFYDATIKAAASVHSPLPKLHDVARHFRSTLLERVVNPLEFGPNWEPFSLRLVETDAQLRLVSLQILLKNPATTSGIATRLAEVGSIYFDPFTGLPMLWSPTQKRLYSVGKDGVDDGGDPTFDISVPLDISLASPAATGSHGAEQ